MRALPQDIADMLGEETATLCRCWRIARTDGVVLGFTDHDARIRFDALDYEPADAVESSTLEISEGLSRDSVELAGALRSGALQESDLAAGAYDAAEVTGWLVDWTAPEKRILLLKGALGDVTRQGEAFVAEVRGVSDALNQPHGRQLLADCDAVLGDARCSLDLSDPAFHAAGALLSADGLTLSATGLESFDVGWFSRGSLEWTSGPLAGTTARIRTHLRSGEHTRLHLWAAPATAPEPGDAFTARAGCDKRFSTCRDKFANLLNFRGFPHMPGEDWLTSAPRRGAVLDGSSRNGV